MKKSIFIILLVLLFTITLGCAKKEETVQYLPLMELEEYKGINIDSIVSINHVKLTEAGRSDELITNSDDILSVYNNLSNIKVGNETTMACDDNTEIYVFKMEDDAEISIEIECDWIVLGNKRYEIKN